MTTAVPDYDDLQRLGRGRREFSPAEMHGFILRALFRFRSHRISRTPYSVGASRRGRMVTGLG